MSVADLAHWHAALPPRAAALVLAAICAACGGQQPTATVYELPSAAPEPAKTASQPSAPSSSAAPAPPSSSAQLELPGVGASVAVTDVDKPIDDAQHAELRGAGFVVRVGVKAENAAVVTRAQIERQIALNDAAEFGMQGLLGTPVRDAGPHRTVDVRELAPRELIMEEEAADHVDFVVWRRRPSGGWLTIECRADDKARRAAIREICLSLRPTR